MTFPIRQWLPCIVLHTLIRGKVGERIGRARKRECKFFNSINHSQRVLLPLFKSSEYECVCVYIVHSRVRASHTYVSSNNQLLLLLYRCGVRLDGPAMCYRLISLKLKKNRHTPSFVLSERSFRRLCRTNKPSPRNTVLQEHFFFLL